jgi:hypothetical protein
VCGRLGFVEHEFVDVAPHPGFAGFEGAHDGVFGGVEVFGGVLVFGGVAAADMAADEAETEMDPSVMHLETFFAALGFGFYGTDLIEMGTFVGHRAVLCEASLFWRLEQELEWGCGPESAYHREQK